MSAAIFISHSSADNTAAADLKARLQEHGYTGLFLDFDVDCGIPPGTDWVNILLDRLSQCQIVIALCSSSAHASKWVFAELVLARSRGKRVIPVVIDDSE